MNNILENQTLELSNVLTYRAKMGFHEISVTMNNIEKFIKDSDANKVGCTTTVTHSVEVINGQQIMDLEFLVPLDKEISVLKDYNFKPVIRVTDALSIRHEGSPALMQKTINKLEEHIKTNNLRVVTGTYNVAIKEPTTQAEVEKIIVDIYVGVSPDMI